MKKKVLQPNVIQGFNDKGELTMYYWQKEPIKTRTGMAFTISRWLWWNPIWRFNQWRYFRKPIVFGIGLYGVSKDKPKKKKEGEK